jgi:hypothetical protein
MFIMCYVREINDLSIYLSIFLSLPKIDDSFFRGFLACPEPPLGQEVTDPLLTVHLVKMSLEKAQAE